MYNNDGTEKEEKREQSYKGIAITYFTVIKLV